jgi:hypothetical protein
LTMVDVAVMVGNTWRHVGSPPLHLSLLPACHYYHPLTLGREPFLESDVFSVSVDACALARVRELSFNQILSALPSYPGLVVTSVSRQSAGLLRALTPRD